MLVLDTNHLTELAHSSLAGRRLRECLLAAGSGVCTTTISVEEEMRGWLARLHRCRHAEERIPLYEKLMERVNFFARWEVLSLDTDSAAAFTRFRSNGIRIGTQDLLMACITMAHGGTLLSRNTVDFQQVPGLRLENWLD